MLTRIHELYVRALGPENEQTLFILGNLAEVHRRLGNYVKEEEICRKMLAVYRRTKGESDFKTINSRCLLVQCLLNQQRIDAAQAENGGLLPLAERVLGPGHYLVGWLRDPKFQAALTS